jgi:flavin-dependent dehydrogenase
MRPETIEADFRRDLRRFPEVAGRLEDARLQGRIRIVGPLRLQSSRQVMGPFIACGDTTGFLDPFTGEGIAHAIATGDMAARTVVASLGGDGDAFSAYAREVKALRRLKGAAALVLHGLVMRPSLADAAATTFARMPRLADSIVQLFGDQV